MDSGLTYGRQRLCESLLLHPDLKSTTGQRFDKQPLERPHQHSPTIGRRQLLRFPLRMLRRWSVPGPVRSQWEEVHLA